MLGKESVKIPTPVLPIPVDQRLFSNRIDLSEAGYATIYTDHPWANIPYFVTDKDGNTVAAGTLDEFAVGSRFFSREAKDVDVWVGHTGWEITEEPLSDDDENEGENV